MVTITSPLSQLIQYETNKEIYFSWSSEYLFTAFEILYKAVEDNNWSTTGKIESTNSFYTWQIPDSIELYKEYYYRIMTYASSDAQGNIKKGYEYSNAYSFILTPKSEGSLKVQASNDMVEIPIYANAEYNKNLNIQILGKKREIPLVEKNNALATPVHVQLKTEQRALGGKNPTFTPHGFYAYNDLASAIQYSYAYGIPYVVYYSSPVIDYITTQNTYSNVVYISGSYKYYTMYMVTTYIYLPSGSIAIPSMKYRYGGEMPIYSYYSLMTGATTYTHYYLLPGVETKYHTAYAYGYYYE